MRRCHTFRNSFINTDITRGPDLAVIIEYRASEPKVAGLILTGPTLTISLCLPSSVWVLGTWLIELEQSGFELSDYPFWYTILK